MSRGTSEMVVGVENPKNIVGKVIGVGVFVQKQSPKGPEGSRESAEVSPVVLPGCTFRKGRKDKRNHLQLSAESSSKPNFTSLQLSKRLSRKSYLGQGLCQSAS